MCLRDQEVGQRLLVPSDKMILPIFAFSGLYLKDNRIFFLFFQNIKIIALSIYFSDYIHPAPMHHSPPPAPSHCLFWLKKRRQMQGMRTGI